MPPMAPIIGLEIFYLKSLLAPPTYLSPRSTRSGGGGWSLGSGAGGWRVRNESSYDGNTVKGIKDGRGLCGGDAEDVEDLVPHNVLDHTNEKIQDKLGRKSVLFFQSSGLLFSLAGAVSLAGQNQH